MGGYIHDNTGIKAGDAQKKEREFIPLGIAVMTVSDTRTEADDRSGDALINMLTSDGHKLIERKIVKDEISLLQAQTKKWENNPDIDVIISTGGTGLTGRDVTPEAMEPIFDKKIDGFSVIFHKISFEKIGLSTIQSRATAGIVDHKLVFCLPGSPGACKDGWKGILSNQLDYRSKPCNFVELIPRFKE